MSEHTLVSIEMVDGIKYIHYSGYGYYAETEIVPGKPYRWVDYTWLMCPLSEALEYGVSKWEEDNQEFVQQYIDDLTEEELDEIYNSGKYEFIKESEITQDMPCQTFWLIRED